MSPLSYTSLKIVHGQMIQEALERRRIPAGSEKPKQELPKTASAPVACFTNHPTQKSQLTFSECDREVECKAS